MRTSEYADRTKCGLSLVSTVHNNASKLEAEVRSAAGHQTHAMPAAGCGEMTHCGPLVLFRVVQEHLVSVGASVANGSVATCSASGVNIIIIHIVQHSPVIMNPPWSSPTPLTPHLPEGRLATSCQALLPPFSRISVDANLL